MNDKPITIEALTEEQITRFSRQLWISRDRFASWLPTWSSRIKTPEALEAFCNQYEQSRRSRVEAKMAVAAWIEQNIEKTFREDVDLSLLADPLAASFILRDGIPDPKPASDDPFWEDDPDPRKPKKYGCNWFIYGTTGYGKTRVLKKLVQTYMMNDPEQFADGYRFDERSVMLTSMELLSDRFAKAHQSDNAESIRKDLLECQILLVDDLGHKKLSDTSATWLLELLKIRFEQKDDAAARTYFTSQYSLKELSRKWTEQCPGQERSIEAMVRRFQQLCQPIKFQKPITGGVKP